MGLKREVWEKRVITKLTAAEQGDFLNGIEDVSRYVTGDDDVQVIHRAKLGVLPDVLINNSTYPIPEQAITDADVPITLDKYQTKATPITDDELEALSYDKIDVVNRLHVESITEKKFDKALHSLAPAADSVTTPVILTTGAADGTRKKLTKADILALRKALDKMKVKRAGRRLVLCPDHVNDILEWDEQFDRQYANRETGEITKKWGFEIYEYPTAPLYDTTTKAKKSFGAVAGVNDREGSVCFFVPLAVKAAGKTKLYASKSENDPLLQRSLMNYRHYFICMPTTGEGTAAIVSNKNP